MLLTKERLYNNGNHREYNEIIRTDVHKINGEQAIRLKFISSNSSRHQGIALVTTNGISIQDQLEQKTAVIWQNEHSSELILNCSKGILNVFNVWEEERMIGYHDSQSGMKLRKEKGVYTYSCNDFSLSSNFTSLVFSIQIL
ncbi:hypothetical protein ABGT24_25605 [Peribacillus frigoritolerans]|uniref:hypothetical protein n=1 Tax=Peribacillus frigoritolerans TaxID=450367 RepID=UPI00345D140D